MNLHLPRSVLLLSALAAALVGCTPRPSVSPTANFSQETRADAGDLTLALESLRRLAEGHEAQPHQRTIFYLNQWVSSEKAASGEWKPDRLVETMPRALRSTPGLESLDRLQFTAQDVPYLQQTLWLHDIAQRVAEEARRNPAPELKPWLRNMETAAGLPESEQLAVAERLFDWTIRNIQLDPLPPPPRAAVAGAGPGSEQAVPAALGQVGPGYSQVPLQVLLHGHGDAHERARVFILLCRQAGIEAVMLGLPEPRSAVVNAWIPAAHIGGELYLFDTGLGLPVPGPGGEGIATLAQAFDDPAVLEQLNLPEHTYPITAESLKTTRVVALVDAEPNALARRMELLQAALPGARRLVLATRPSEVDAKVRSRVLGQASLWRVPLEAILYQQGRLFAMQNDPEAFMAYQREQMVLALGTPLSQGRNLHLQGRYDRQDQEPGARSLYLEARTPDAEMDALQRSKYIREKSGLQQQLPDDPQQQAEALKHIRAVMVTQKQDATYWIGLTYFEAGNYRAAVEWLAERTLPAIPPSPWTPGAKYNLARCYEQTGQLDLARRWLESDTDSPQRHGNLLRAQWLAQRQPAAAGDTASVDSP